MQIVGAILAGGQGRRMNGADKALLMLDGAPLVQHAFSRLAPQVSEVLISANGDPQRFVRFGCEVLPDTQSQGPLSGVLASVLRAAELGASHVATIPVDTPFVPPDLVGRLAQAARSSPSGLAVAESEGQLHPLCSLWPVTLAPALADYLAQGHAKVVVFTEQHQAALASFPDPNAFVNLNTPDDLAAAEAMLRGAA